MVEDRPDEFLPDGEKGSIDNRAAAGEGTSTGQRKDDHKGWPKKRARPKSTREGEGDDPNKPAKRHKPQQGEKVERDSLSPSLLKAIRDSIRDSVREELRDSVRVEIMALCSLEFAGGMGTSALSQETDTVNKAPLLNHPPSPSHSMSINSSLEPHGKPGIPTKNKPWLTKLTQKRLGIHPIVP